MRFIRLVLSSALALGWTVALGAQTTAPVAQNPKLELKGLITRVGLTPGAGMPHLLIRTEDGREWKVWLGSMRYLIDSNFNPKAGQKVSIEAYKTQNESEAVAASVTLVDTKQTLKLRDEQGRPLWRGGAGPRRQKR